MARGRRMASKDGGIQAPNPEVTKFSGETFSRSFGQDGALLVIVVVM